MRDPTKANDSFATNFTGDRVVMLAIPMILSQVSQVWVLFLKSQLEHMLETHA